MHSILDFFVLLCWYTRPQHMLEITDNMKNMISYISAVNSHPLIRYVDIVSHFAFLQCEKESTEVQIKINGGKKKGKTHQKSDEISGWTNTW